MENELDGGESGGETSSAGGSRNQGREVTIAFKEPMGA